MRKFLTALSILVSFNAFAIEHMDMNKYLQIKNEKGKYIIDFYAPWCPPCKIMGEYLKKLDNYKGVKIYKVNIDENQDLSSLFNITSIPTLIFVKNSSIVNTINGLVPSTTLKEEIDKTF